MRGTIVTVVFLSLASPSLVWAATPLCNPATADCYGLQVTVGAGANSNSASQVQNDGVTTLTASASYDPAGLGFSNALAIADLANGAVRLQLSDTFAGAYAQSAWFDRVSFVLPTGLSSLDVPVTWRINGTNQFQSESDMPTNYTSRSVSGTFRFRPAFDNSLDSVNFTLTNCQFMLCADGSNSGEFSDVITIKPGVLYELAMDMTIIGQNVNMDFSHTAFFNWQLPSGVTVNSSSGVLLSSPLPDGAGTSVPEPQTWALLISGFGLVGGALRKRRSAASRRAPLEATQA